MPFFMYGNAVQLHALYHENAKGSYLFKLLKESLQQPHLHLIKHLPIRKYQSFILALNPQPARHLARVLLHGILRDGHHWQLFGEKFCSIGQYLLFSSLVSFQTVKTKI